MYIEEYLKYLTEWSSVRNRVRFEFPASYWKFVDECIDEDEQNGQDYEDHIASFSAGCRYV